MRDPRTRGPEPSPERASEDARHLASVLAIVAEAVISVDESQRIIFFNRGAVRIFGYEPAEVLGRPLDILLPERYRAAHRAHVEAFSHSSVTARRMGERLEVRALRRGGEEFPAEASIARTEDDRGTVLTVVLRDVTERQRAQAALATRERQLAEAQKIAHVGSWVWDVSADTVEWSDEMYRIHGLEPGSPIDYEGVLDRVDERDRAGVRGRIGEIVEAGGSFDFQHRIVRPDGAVRWVHSRGEALVGGDGRVVRLLGTAQDVTRLRRATARARRLAVERAARRAAEAAERRMAFLARASAELASSLDYEATLRTVARLAVPEMADWCGVDLVAEDGRIQRLAAEHQDPEKVALVQRITERYPPDADAQYGAPNVIRTGRTEIGAEVPDELLVAAARDEEHLRLLRSLGLRSYVVAPLVVRGRVFGAMTFVHAESGRKYDRDDCLLVEDLARRAAAAIDHAKLVTELSRAVQAKGDFLATMSHELRTPLNAIIGYTELLSTGVPDPIPDTARTYTDRIGLSARHLLQLIDEVLTFSRLQADREVVDLSELDLDQLLDEIRAIIGPLAETQGLGFQVTRGDCPARVRTDPRKLRQILLNLLGNAIKFTDQGRVDLHVAQEDHSLVFHVIDTGRGIAHGERPHLFEAFWQGDQSATRNRGGAGLGLAISDRFARLLGGEIAVESEPGQGSRFTVRLPLEE
jgi:PAS domain S-box-containing protein